MEKMVKMLNKWCTWNSAYIILLSSKLKMKGMTKLNDNFFVDTTKSLGKGNFGTVYKGYRLD